MAADSPPVAAIDCGTNSTRLLILSGDGSRLDRQMTITRLGEGVDRNRALSAAAIERTLGVLRQYRAAMDRHFVTADNTRAAATSATRDASNSAAFLDPAEQILGVRPEVIPGTEEGALAFHGATASLEVADGPYTVIDVGGGSTELIFGPADSRSAPRAVVSLDIGCVRVTERYLLSDPPTPAQLDSARAAVRAHVAEVVQGRSEEAPGAGRLVGVAGTVSALTVLALGLAGFDEEKVNHTRLTVDEIDALTARLAALPVAERRNVYGMEVERADVIVGGGVVLGEAARGLGYSELTASEADILDGMAAELLER